MTASPEARTAARAGAAGCRFCGAALGEPVLDLGAQPLANAVRRPEDAKKAEARYPLRLMLCNSCHLAQLEEFAAPDEIFSDYVYFSSYSESWLRHAERFADDAIRRFALGADNRVVEIASNDGYLLQYFRTRGIPVLGIEPAANVAEAAIARGVPTLVRFFGTETAEAVRAEHGPADLIVANNVLAHVPALNDFVAGLARLLAAEGVLSVEAPHLLTLLGECQFDTIYHEHFSYFSMASVARVFAAHGLALFDVVRLPTHGGSLRYLAGHRGAHAPNVAALAEVRAIEEAAGLDTVAPYRDFSGAVASVKAALLTFLEQARSQGRSVVGYGAPAKGNTLLNYCGIGPDLLPYTVDRSPHKIGLLLPGSGIPIAAPERIAETRPDYVLILPWNLRAEITAQMAYIREWGGRFVTAIPALDVF